ncbi:MAG TPA: SEFIR domain-containing protein [Pyrinomonadaceae bacterium]|jgi:tetratricopeptide (TPR) repeat protein
MLTADINVFISYSHDSSAHEARVLALADRLREEEGVAAVIDRYQTAPPEGWQLWMEKQIAAARFVLLVCTETYLRRVMKEETPGKGLGVLWEASIIYSHLYEAGGVNEKFIPVVFEQSDTQFIPRPLKLTTYYEVSTDEGYEKLCRRLTDQHETPAPPLGQQRALPPRQRATPPPPAQPSPRLAPNLVHPYPMQANFTGRVREREELTAWLADDARPVCALTAMGGMGKSALAWYWITNDVLPGDQSAAAEGVMWWSFYEGESSFARFIDDAFRYVTGQTVIDAARFPTTYDRAQELRQQLQRRRVLFILDGFERQLRAYARLDAAYQQDAAADTSADARACVDPTAARWLRDIASGATRAKVLLTTRLTPRDLEDRADFPLAGVLKRELTELPPDDAVRFLRAQGVAKGIDSELARVCADYGNHPLSLRLLSGLIARDARTPGDIAAAPRHDVHADLIQRQHHILEQSYNALPKKERTLLSRIAAFRNPMTYDALAIFDNFGFANHPNAKKFDAALEDLRVRGLLQRDTNKNRYDLHPIVRRYAYDRLADKTGVHTRLHDYFAKIPAPDADKVQSIDDLAPVIELYHHTVRAGRYDEAAELFYDRLGNPLYFRFGAYQIYIELLGALFSDGEDRPPRLKSEGAQAWTLNTLANSYDLSGQSRRSLPLSEQTISLREKLDDKKNLAVGLGNIATTQLNLGELTAAARHLTRSIELCHEVENEFGVAVSHRELGKLLAYCGEFDEAETEMSVAQEIFDRRYKNGLMNNSVSTVRAYRSLRAVLMGNINDALTMARESRKWADEVAGTLFPSERDFIRAEWLLGVALVIEGKNLNAADGHLSDALTRCRRINMVDHEPDILLAWARWHRARGNAEEAQTQAEEALAIADRCEYRLKQAEIHNFLARLALEAGRREEARAQAERAKERAWCDGPPYCYKPALDEAEGLLRELGRDEG